MALGDFERSIRLLTCSVGSESFVFDIMRVVQIVPYQETVQVPGAPSFIEGVMVLRGEVIPVIDLYDRFFHEPSSAELSLVLITRTPFGLIGLRVDEVRRILTIPLGEILPAPPIIHGLRGELFIGVVEREDEVALLIDVDHLLTEKEAVDHRRANYRAAVVAEPAIPTT